MRTVPQLSTPEHRITVGERARDRLIECDLHRVTGIDEVVATVQELTGRPIVISSLALGDRYLHAALVATEKVDYIIHESQTSPLHRQHIILHELSHRIWGHLPALTITPTEETPTPTNLGETDPIRPVREAGRFPPRHGYRSDQEDEAETMASLLGYAIATAAGRTTHSGWSRLLSSLNVMPEH